MDKLEDEPEPGDLMKNRKRNKEVVVEDIQDSGEEYKYELYEIADEEGEQDEVEKMDLALIDENPERLLPRENPEMKTAASGGTGYGDYQEKITNTSGSGMAGDVSGSHEPDVYPMDHDSRKVAPVPSQEYKKSLERAKQTRQRHRNSVAMRRVNAIATEVVGLINFGMYNARIRRAGVDHNTGVDHTGGQSASPNPGPYKPQNVSGNPIGGGYSVNESQQTEQAAGVSELEHQQAHQYAQESAEQGNFVDDQQQAIDLAQQYQLRMMGASVEKKKLQIILGSSTGAEDPADSSVNQLESEDDGRLRSKTDDTRKVLLHEHDEDAKADSATFPKHRDQLKPLP